MQMNANDKALDDFNKLCELAEKESDDQLALHLVTSNSQNQ